MTKEQLFAEICSGREDAFEFINLWLKHAHEVDDLVDNKTIDSQKIVTAFINAYGLFTHPFFLKHKAKLYPLHILAATAYVNSNQLTTDHPQLADGLRSFGNHLLILVAAICAPEDKPVFDRMCWLGVEIHKQSWILHHDKNGEPV